MKRALGAILAFALTAGLIVAQDIRRGTLKSADGDTGTITVTVDGKDVTLYVGENAKVMTANGKIAEKPFAEKAFKPGDLVAFKSRAVGGKDTLVAMRVNPDPKAAPQRPPFDSSKLKPLPELGREKYQGFEGGFYPGGKNERPSQHEAAGLALAKQVQPRDGDGQPLQGGKIVLLSIGMSNTTQAFSTFKRIADADPAKNPDLIIVDGAQGGMTAARIQDAESQSGMQFWSTVDARLKSANVSRAQVQVAWIKQADAGPSSGFPKYAQTLRDELRTIVQLMKARFPNLKIVYLSSRTFGGYAKTGLNPEPYAYESAFSVKWLIEEQLTGAAALNYDPRKGDVNAPWLSWGPYLWANGTIKNPDGLSYEESDFGNDGTHPSASGQRKVAERLLAFFTSDSTAKPWFIR